MPATKYSGWLSTHGDPSADVVGHEVEHQSHAALLQARPQPRQRRVAAQQPVNRVTGDGKSRPGDVFFPQIRQRLAELGQPLRLASRHALGRRTGLPHAQQPDPVEAATGQTIEIRVGNVVERGRPPEPTSELGEPYSRVDLKKRGISGHA